MKGMTISTKTSNYDESGKETPLEDAAILFRDVPFIKTYRKIEYANVPAAFDIETSSFDTEDGEKYACMYAFVFGVNGKAVIGRTWDEAMGLFRQAVEALSLSLDRRLIVYVHNLSYEFQFIRDRFVWDKIFATEERKPIYAVTRDGIEFRCSYRLTGYNRELTGKHLVRHPVGKKVGDLDYRLLRHSKTPLTEKERGYILNDGLVVMAHIQEEIENRGNRIDRIPLTKTGNVRKYVRDACLYEGSHKKNPGKYLKYRRIMKNLTLRPLEYKQLKDGFQGGFTHASNLWSRYKASDVSSYDFTSSYPSVMIAERFPMSKGEYIRIKDREDFEKNLRLYCCLFVITFEGLEATFPHEHYISSSKCRRLSGEVLDNGRVVSADHLETTITEVDYEIIKKTYRWDKMFVRRFIRYQKGYLPHDFVKAILDLYKRKTELKGVPGMEAEYQQAKELLNSCYGMTVTDVAREEIVFENGEWSVKDGDLEKQIEAYNNSRRRFLAYQWGVWTTAYARRNLWSGILEFGPDYLYSDTDSLKIIHRERHEAYIARYNDKVTRKIKRALAYHGFPEELAHPKSKDGKEKPLGVWDYEGTYDHFKTLGAKRYMIEENGELSLTVSGVNKKFAIPCLLSTYKTNAAVLDAFDDDLIIPPEWDDGGVIRSGTGKNTHTYIDWPKKGVIVDYRGVPGEYDEESVVHMAPAGYELSMARAYLDYLLRVQDSVF